MTLEINDLQHRYPGAEAGVSIASLSIRRGSSLAIIGPSGCGKTTFLNLLSGLLSPDRGSIRIDGVDVSAMSARASRRWRAASVGHVFQDFGLLDYLSALDNILHPFRICPGRRVTREVREKAASLAESLGVAGHLDHRPAQLSHGERQRVAICRAVVTDPQIILADEPTGNLDPETAARVMAHLHQLRGRLGATLVAATHDHAMLKDFDQVLDFHPNARIAT